MTPPKNEPPPHGASTVSRRSLLIGAGVAAGAVLVGADLTNTAVPASAWGGYSNGQIPLSELTQVGGYYFRNDAAQAMVALRAAYASALGRTLIINDGYRDLAGQQQAWNDYQNGGNLAAPPGTSNHGWAIAVDFGGEVYSSSSSTGHQWLQAHAETYGWWWAGQYFSQVENWHWEYNGTYNPQNPTTPIEEDLDMATQLWLYTPTNSLLVVDHVNMTYRNLGNTNTIERAAFDSKPYRQIGEPAWTQNFGNFKGITSPA